MSKLISSLVFLALIPGTALAQIAPDSSLGAENSVVESSGNRDTINGGAIRDANLFHSFQEFNVEALREAYFANPDGIANIFSRVTGSNLSDIQGVLGVLGNANLYLINPNGILFGENARLDVNGSFFASTADSVLFENGFEFSAVNPSQPPLLTIDIPIGLRFRDNPAPITNRSVANEIGLQVDTGQTLALIGGEITFDGGKITAPGSNIELGGLITSGTITIEDNFRVGFPKGAHRANVFFSNAAEINVASDGGGSISINAGNINLTGESQLLGGIAEGLGNLNSQAGDIILNATGAVTLSEESNIQNHIKRNATGNSGNIKVNAEFLSVKNGASLNTNSYGQGNSGNITFNIQDAVNFSGFGINSARRIVNSQVGSQLGTEAEGTAGNINIKAESLSLDNGAKLISSIRGQGNAGNITLDIQGAVNLSGFTLESDGTIISHTQISSLSLRGAKGTAGNIDIKAQSLSLDNGAALINSSWGQGNSGNITLDIQDTVNVSGFASNSNETRLSVSFITSALGGEGKAGNIDIKARSFSLDNGGALFNSSWGLGDAGDINLNIQDTVSISGFAFNKTGISNSQISSDLGVGAEGKAGNINIKTRSLSLEDLGQIKSITSGIGDAGNIHIQSRSLTLKKGSQILTSVFRTRVDNPAGKGQGGDIIINATDFVYISGVSSDQIYIPDPSNDPLNSTGLIPVAGFASGLLAATERGAIGDAGSISVTTNVFRIADGAVIDNSTTNNSNAGDITINANTFEAISGGQIIAATRGNGNAADIKLNIAESIFISGSDPNFAARLARANEFGAIQGGENIVTNQGAASGIFANTSADSTGNGGNIKIGIFKPESENLILDTEQFTQEITLANGARIAAESQGEGSGGAISIQAEDLALDNEAEILAETKAQQDDNNALSEINLGVANILQLKNDSRISSQALSNADGGNINIDAKFIIAFPGQNEGNDILTRAAQGGDGGNINITTEALFGIEERKATPGNRSNDIDASSEFGLSGEVTITRPDVDPTSSLLELTQDVVDPSDLIAQNVCTQTADSEFVDIGKGGLPQNPQDRLAEDFIEVGLVAPIITSSEATEPTRARIEIKPKRTRKPPAQGWIFHDNGIVELVAYNPNQVGEQRTWDNHKGCRN